MGLLKIDMCKPDKLHNQFLEKEQALVLSVNRDSNISTVTRVVSIL